jgi:hypothetical protein
MLRKKDREELEKLNKEWENWSDLLEIAEPELAVPLLLNRIDQLEKFIASVDTKQED